MVSNTKTNVEVALKDRLVRALDQLTPAALESILAEANMPALIAALCHQSGDLSLIRGDIKPKPDQVFDAQSGISADDQLHLRQLAAQRLQQFIAEPHEINASISTKTAIEIAEFLMGRSLDEDYVDLLMSEIGIAPSDATLLEEISQCRVEDRQQLPVLIIGAGMSGLLAAIKLKQCDIPFVVIEKNAEVGGTWYLNTYPGCRVDIVNQVYSYSFAQQRWPQHFSTQPILLDYFKQCVDEFKLNDVIRFNTEVVELKFIEANHQWQVTLKDQNGNRQVLNYSIVISAVGQLNRPKLPDIKGSSNFKGLSFHSSNWPKEIDLTQKKVLVVGTGASAFQFVPAIADACQHLRLFQRTPAWMLPREDYYQDIAPGQNWLLENLPFYRQWMRFLLFYKSAEGLFDYTTTDDNWQKTGSVSRKNQALRQLLTQYMIAKLGKDHPLANKIIPDYPPAAKRMLIDDGTWLETLKRDHVSLITDPIENIDADGINTKSGEHHQGDVLIYATGFRASEFLMPMQVYGRNGISLAEYWRGDAKAYLGMTMPNFPNLFCMYGPNTNIVVNGSIIFFSECEIHYILACLNMMLADGYRSLECDARVFADYNDEIDQANRERAWGMENVQSWYKNEFGRVSQNWPYSTFAYWQRTRHPNPADFIKKR